MQQRHATVDGITRSSSFNVDAKSIKPKRQLLTHMQHTGARIKPDIFHASQLLHQHEGFTEHIKGRNHGNVQNSKGNVATTGLWELVIHSGNQDSSESHNTLTRP